MQLRSMACVNQRSVAASRQSSLVKNRSSIRTVARAADATSGAWDQLKLISDAGKQELKSFGIKCETAKVLAEVLGYSHKGDLKYCTSEMKEKLNTLQTIQMKKVDALAIIQRKDHGKDSDIAPFQAAG